MNKDLNLELETLFPSSKENAPHKARHYLILVARGGIEPPTQGFSTPLLDSTSLSKQEVAPQTENFVQSLRSAECFCIACQAYILQQ